MQRRTRRRFEGLAALAVWRRHRRHREERVDEREGVVRERDGGRGAGVVAGAGTAAGALGRLLAFIVNLVVGVIVLIIAAAILFVVLDANAGNSIVSHVHDLAKTLVGPFDGLFTPKDHKLAIAIDWGIALIVYVIIGRLIVRLLVPLMALGERRRRVVD